MKTLMIIAMVYMMGCSASVSKVGTTQGGSDLFETTCFSEQECDSNAKEACVAGYQVKTMTSTVMSANGIKQSSYYRMEFLCSAR